MTTVETFETYRPYLFSIAYRMLGSVMDAEEEVVMRESLSQAFLVMAIHPVIGRAAVAQFAVGASRRFLPPDYRVELSEVNYQPAVIVRAGDRALVVMTIEVEARRVKTVRFIVNPDKLAHL